MKVSGKIVADAILQNLKKEIEEKKLKPGLAIILAGDNPASRIYVSSKIKVAESIGINTNLYEFSHVEMDKCLKTIDQLNVNQTVHGIIVQYPTYDTWDFEKVSSRVSLEKDVDGFQENSPFRGATALAVWEMIKAFAKEENSSSVEEFLKNKKIMILGKGRTAGSPTIKLIREKGFEITVVDSRTENPDEIIRNADFIISATGKKNIINGSNIKEGVYVIGVGVGKEIIDGESKIYGDINEQEVSKKAKLYCPTIGGIGPLTIACLLRNVVESAKKMYNV